MSRRNSRRNFIKSTALAGAGFWVASSTPLARSRSINERINFACIGVGGKGTSDSNSAAKHGNVVAICDIDEQRLAGAAKRFPNAKKFVDFRDMLVGMDEEIDAVTVSTPDHTHAPASIMAMKMGKHCFCQKPLTHSLHEARQMADVARQTGVKTQMGNQGTASPRLREAAEIVQSGAIGTVHEAHVWTNRPVWPQGKARPTPQRVPAHVHWDLFLGTAPYRPYAPGYHPFAWRGWWDFGTGALGDMACHTMNMPFMALGLHSPVSVEAESSGHDQDSYPANSRIRYEFPATDQRPAVTMIWYDGGQKPPEDLFLGEARPNTGSLLVGDAGRLLSPNDYGATANILLPRPKFKGYKPPSPSIARSPGHFTEFARAINGGPAAMSNFPDYSGPLTETVLLGNLAVWAAKKVEWDAKNLKATNAPEVASIIKREYREGYAL